MNCAAERRLETIEIHPFRCGLISSAARPDGIAMHAALVRTRSAYIDLFSWLENVCASRSALGRCVRLCFCEIVNAESDDRHQGLPDRSLCFLHSRSRRNSVRRAASRSLTQPRTEPSASHRTTIASSRSRWPACVQHDLRDGSATVRARSQRRRTERESKNIN